MASRDPFDNLKGLAALSEIGRRLSDLGDQVKETVKDGSAADMRVGAKATEGLFGGVAQTSFRIRTLSGSEMARPMRRGGGMGAGAERPRGSAPDIDGAREALVDCFDEGNVVVVTAELPGVKADEITLSVEGRDLAIETTGMRRYRARQQLPAAVDDATLAHDFRNGILEVRITKVPPVSAEPAAGAKP